MSASGVARPSGPQVGPYVFGKTLGTGATGKVKLAQHVETKEMVAVKIVRKDFLLKKPSLKRKLQREITVMKLCDHPNVLKLIDVFEIETHLFLVIEFVDGCELFDYLVKRQFLPPAEALNFFHQIVAGLEYCHKRLICHRDLKPENLLLDRNLNVKVADFGMTSLNPPGSFLETSCGSPHYAAPEVVSGEMYNGLEADIWSTGVILYAMLTGRLPFDDDSIQKLLSKVQRGVYHIPSDMPAECKSLVRAMLTVDPSKRITIEGIKQHPWYKSMEPPAPHGDDFDPPADPIGEPDQEVLQGLVDLGWGTPEKIAADLMESESNITKVFYIQLSKHPMFQRGNDSEGGAPSLASAPPKAQQAAASDRWLPPEWQVHYDKQKADADAKKKETEGSALPDGRASSSNAEVDEHVDTPVSLPPHVLATFAKMKDSSATVTESSATMKKSDSQLVRQSEIVTRSTPHEDSLVEKTGSQNGEEKSWFGGFTSVFGSRPNSQG